MNEGFSLSGKRVWVPGHRGMVGSALLRRLEREALGEILVAERETLDLRNGPAVHAWAQRNRPDVVFVPAAKVGGILANKEYPADFLYDNLMIATNVIEASFRAGVGKLLFLGSSCIYPRLAEQPIEEASLLTGPLEPTNEAYAIAKIAGVKLCQAYRRQHGVDFVSAMPTNLYGPGDNYDLETSHVIPALIAKADTAKRSGAPALTIWGSGRPRREFLHVDDCADALVTVMKRYSAPEPINIGCGEDITIGDLARAVVRAVGYRGELQYDRSKPDGTPRKLLNVDKLRALGWAPSIDLEPGLIDAYRWYLEHVMST